MKAKRWVACNLETCPNCGGQVEMLTDMTDDEIDRGYYQDGDECRCLDNCEAILVISSDDDNTYIRCSDDEDAPAMWAL